MRNVEDSNAIHDDNLIPISLAYPARNFDYGYLYSLKASSRVINTYTHTGYLEKTTFSINEKSKAVIMEQGFQNVFKKIDTCFIVLKDAKEKIYSGILEVSEYKNYRHGKHEMHHYIHKVLKKYLEDNQGPYLDMHHGRYFESLYYTILGIQNKKLFSIDLDNKDYKYTYNIVEAKDFYKESDNNPKHYTNSNGYDVLRSVLNALDIKDSIFWYELIAREQLFEKLVRKKLTPISKINHQRFVNSKHNPYIV
jgi:hypothetical protein